MTSFLPSEIARLVLGYLKEEGCSKSYKTFLKESPYLAEYRTLLEQGREFPTSIVGKGLTDMLEEYGQLKIQEAQPTSDVWCKFDKVVNQLRNVASQRPVGPKPQDMATFQRKRGVYNANKNKRNKVQFMKDSRSGEGDMFQTTVSMFSEPASSPGSHVGGESPDSSAETHPNSSGETQKSVSLLHSSDGGGGNSRLTSTSTPGSSKSDQAHISHSFPFQSPIVVSDSDHPFSPDSYPGTPGCSLQHHQAVRDVQESPKSHHLPLKVSSPLLTRARNESLPGSPRFKLPSSSYSAEKMFKSNSSNNNNDIVLMDGTLSEREKQIVAMRTGVLSHLTKTNLDIMQQQAIKNTIVDVSTFKNIVKIKALKGNVNLIKKNKVYLLENRDVTELQNDDNMSDDTVPDHDDEDLLVIASPIKVPNKKQQEVKSKINEKSSNNSSSILTPSKVHLLNGSKEAGQADTTLPFGTQFKTPVKAVLDGECSRDGFKTPKRKRNAPKRRSFDPNMSRESLVTPVKDPPILSMPMLEELVNNTKLVERLADSINKGLTKPEEKKRTPCHSPAPGSRVVTPKEDSTHPITKQKQVSPAVSPCRTDKRSSIDLTGGTPISVDGNDSTGSIKPPLSNEELNSILEDTHMSENTIQGIINMTQNDPEFDALFSLFNVDKHEFIEKEYGISLNDYKLTPFKNSASNSTVTQGNISSQNNYPHTGSSSQIGCVKSCLSTLSSQSTSLTFTNLITSNNESTSNSKQSIINYGNIQSQSTAVGVAEQTVSTHVSQKQNHTNNTSLGLNHNVTSISCQPSTSLTSALPTIHVQSVQQQPNVKTSSTSLPSTTATNSGSGSFLQLLHSSTDTQQSFVETVQLLNTSFDGQSSGVVGDANVSQSSLGFTETLTSIKVGDGQITSDSGPQTAPSADAEANMEPAGQDTTDSNGSEDTVLELPNGIKLSVLPAGTDIDSQLQTLQTLTQLQKLLQSGFSLTPAGEAVTTASTTGSSSIVTPVKLSSKPSVEGVTVATPSPGTASMIQAVNTQQLCMIQPRFEQDSSTVDTSGLGLVTCPPDIPKPKQELSLKKKSQKKGRGRPKVKAAMKSPSPEKPKQQEGNVPVTISGRIGMKDRRSDKRKNLSIPSTVVIPKSLQEQTQGRPIITVMDGKQVMLMPVVSTPQGATYMLPKNAKDIGKITSLIQPIVPGRTLRDLLQTTMAGNILGSNTITSLSSQSSSGNLTKVVPSSNTGSVQINQNSSEILSAQKVLSSHSSAEPSPTRRKLFGLDATTPTLQSQNPLVKRRVNLVTADSPSQKATTSIHSMGSMLLSPPGKKSVKSIDYSSGNTNVLHVSTIGVENQQAVKLLSSSLPGVYTIEKQSNDDNIGGNIEHIVQDVPSGSDVSTSVSSAVTPVKRPTITPSESVVSIPVHRSIVTAVEQTSVKTKLNSDENGVISMPSDFGSLLSPGPSSSKSIDNVQKESENSLPVETEPAVINPGNKMLNVTKQPRRVQLKKVPEGQNDSNDSFQTPFPNLVSQSNLMAQPGNVEEIVSQSFSKTRNEIYDDSSRVSFVSALRNIDESEDVEIAQTLIEFSTGAVVTPKKIEIDTLDENSNTCGTTIIETEMESTETSSESKRRKSTARACKSNLQNRDSVQTTKNVIPTDKGKSPQNKKGFGSKGKCSSKKVQKSPGQSSPKISAKKTPCKGKLVVKHRTPKKSASKIGKGETNDSSSEVIVINSPTFEDSTPKGKSRRAHSKKTPSSKTKRHIIKDSPSNKIIVINSPPPAEDISLPEVDIAQINKPKMNNTKSDISSNLNYNVSAIEANCVVKSPSEGKKMRRSAEKDRKLVSQKSAKKLSKSPISKSKSSAVTIASTSTKDVKMSFIPCENNVVSGKTALSKGINASISNSKPAIIKSSSECDQLKNSATVATVSMSKLVKSPTVKVSEKVSNFTVVKEVSLSEDTSIIKSGEPDISEEKSVGKGKPLSDRQETGHTADVKTSKTGVDQKLCDSSNMVPLSPNNNDLGFKDSSKNVENDIKKSADLLKTPEKQSIPKKLKPGPSPYRSLSLAKLLEVSQKEMITRKIASPSKKTKCDSTVKNQPNVCKVLPLVTSSEKTLDSSKATKRKLQESPSCTPHSVPKKPKLSVSNLQSMNIEEAMKKLKKHYKKQS